MRTTIDRGDEMTAEERALQARERPFLTFLTEHVREIARLSQRRGLPTLNRNHLLENFPVAAFFALTREDVAATLKTLAPHRFAVLGVTVEELSRLRAATYGVVRLHMCGELVAPTDTAPLAGPYERYMIIAENLIAELAADDQVEHKTSKVVERKAAIREALAEGLPDPKHLQAVDAVDLTVMHRAEEGLRELSPGHVALAEALRGARYNWVARIAVNPGSRRVIQ